MVPFNRPYTTYYRSVTVSIALSCTISSYLMLMICMTLKSGLRVTQGHWHVMIRKPGYGFLFVFYSNYGCIFSHSASSNGATLKTELGAGDCSRSLKMAPVESLCTISHSPSIVTTAVTCIILEIKRDIGQKSQFFQTTLHSTPPLGVPVRILT